MVLVFLVVVLGALGFALMQDRTYHYTSIYEVAQRSIGSGSDAGLESPAAVVAKINSLYLGPTTRQLRDQAEVERLPFDVNVSNPQDTLLINVTSEASENDQELVLAMHTLLLERVEQNQQRLLERTRENLERQLERAERNLQAAERVEGLRAAEMLVSHMERVANLQDRLTQLNEGQVVQVAIQSLEPTGTSRSLILALGIVLGGILALMAAFLSHFASLVRLSLNDE